VERTVLGVNKIRTAQSARLHCTPKRRGGQYLDLFLAQKRLERLERERENVGARSRQIDEEFAELAAEIEKLQEEVGVVPAAPPPATCQRGVGETKKTPRRTANMKTMDLSY